MKWWGVAVVTLMLGEIGFAQPWPLIRLRQANGAPGTAGFEVGPRSAPDAGIQVFGFTSITGRPETWQMETHLSFAGMEEFDAAGRQDRANGITTMVMVHRHNWSHRPDEALLAIGKAKYFQISMFQVGLGSESDFASLIAQRKARLDSINLDRPDLAYQVLYGAPAGTVILISPITSLKSLDEGVSRWSGAYFRSTGTPGQPRGGAGSPVSSPVSEVLQDNILFRILPAYSAVSRETAAADTAFWTTR
jgi:hypothetical protein